MGGSSRELDPQTHKAVYVSYDFPESVEYPDTGWKIRGEKILVSKGSMKPATSSLIAELFSHLGDNVSEEDIFL